MIGVHLLVKDARLEPRLLEPPIVRSADEVLSGGHGEQLAQELLWIFCVFDDLGRKQQVVLAIHLRGAREILAVDVAAQHRDAFLAHVESIETVGMRREREMQIRIGIEEWHVATAHVQHAAPSAALDEQRTPIRKLGDCYLLIEAIRAAEHLFKAHSAKATTGRDWQLEFGLRSGAGCCCRRRPGTPAIRRTYSKGNCRRGSARCRPSCRDPEWVRSVH